MKLNQKKKNMRKITFFVRYKWSHTNLLFGWALNVYVYGCDTIWRNRAICGEQALLLLDWRCGPVQNARDAQLCDDDIAVYCVDRMSNPGVRAKRNRKPNDKKNAHR